MGPVPFLSRRRLYADEHPCPWLGITRVCYVPERGFPLGFVAK